MSITTVSTSAPPAVERRILLDIDRCIGCKSCSAACFYSHMGMPSVAYGIVAEGTLPLICRQCEEPACVEACPVKALRREPSGVVRRSRMLCIGCRSCVYACPFGVVSQELLLRQVAKCDMCEERVLAGELPACVAACPAGALRFDTPEEREKNRLLLLGGRAAGHHPFKRR